MNPDDFGYVTSHNICLFQKGPFSNWYGAYKNQGGGFDASPRSLWRSVGKENRWAEILLSGDPWCGTGLLRFNCVEQWMMAAKAVLFEDYETYEAILKETNPANQKALGRKIKGYDDKAWAAVRKEAVKIGVRFKFEQNKPERDFLLSFHPATIFAEGSHWDAIWGIGLDLNNNRALDIYEWQGINLLGEIIRELRQEFGNG